MKDVTFDTIQTRQIMNQLTLSGQIQFDEDHVVRVYPLVSGDVGDVPVSLGDYVHKGQALAYVRSAEMANYQNDLRSAQSSLDIAKKNMEVADELRKTGVGSDKDYLTAQSELQIAQADYNRVKALLNVYGATINSDSTGMSGYAIRAPIDGFLVEKNINSGMEIRQDDDNTLFTISDLKEVWAVANVYESDIAKVEIGSHAEISTLAYPDKKFDGIVEHMSNVLNPDTKVLNLKIRLKNPDYLLKPGLFARITFTYPDNRKMISVASDAVIFEDNVNYVVKYKGDCAVSMQPVTIYKSYNDVDYIQSDSLREGDHVINRTALFIFTALNKM